MSGTAGNHLKLVSAHCKANNTFFEGQMTERSWMIFSWTLWWFYFGVKKSKPSLNFAASSSLKTGQEDSETEIRDVVKWSFWNCLKLIWRSAKPKRTPLERDMTDQSLMNVSRKVHSIIVAKRLPWVSIRPPCPRSLLHSAWSLSHWTCEVRW